jgi:8-oxo-dGTP pyrophosphatase MutT (NUDIX family)
MPDEEMIDVVDESGAVVNTVLKTVAHEKGLLHKTVIGEIVDSQGRWMLVTPAGHKQDAGQYVSPMGGHVQAGESEVDALKREIAEEVGLTGDFKYEYVGRAIFNRTVLGRKENHFFVVYKVFADHDNPVFNDELVGHRWFTEDELKKELKDHPEKFGGAFHFVVQNIFPHLLS